MSSIILDEDQSKAIDIMNQRWKHQAPMTVIGGYAGTGKSTLINYFIENAGLMEHTRFVAYTGKAALVLQQKGLPATTIHRLIYTTYRNKKTGRFYFRLKKALDPNIKLIIVDEISMVSTDILKDLMFFKIPIIALGDPFQLPPVLSNPNDLLESPNIFLNNIHRQALDNSIIRYSMDIREGKRLPFIYDDSNVKILHNDEATMGMMKWADQIICATNPTRHWINDTMREECGFIGTMPNVGDKIICLRNYWDTVNDNDVPLTNGTIGTVDQITLGKDYGVLGQQCWIDFTSDFDSASYPLLEVDSNIFKGQAPLSITNMSAKKMYYEFDYAYAITGHKSQGSEWDKILIFEEGFPQEHIDHLRWLYTVWTRSSDKIVLIRKRGL